MRGYLPQVSDIFLYNCKPGGLDWGHYHLLVLQLFETVQDRNETCAVRCIVLESGQLHEVYADELVVNGDKVA